MAKLENIHVEQEILGLLISNRGQFSECNLNHSDFSQRSHQVIFEAIQQVVSDGHAIDIISTSEAIENAYGDEFIQMEYMGELFQKSCAAPSNMEKFCDIVKNSSELRQARSILAQSLNRIESDNAGGVVEDAIKQLMEIDKAKKKYEHTMKDAVVSAMEIYEQASQKNGLIGITTGIEGLDESLGGFHNSDLIIVGARPALGKTAIAFNFAHHATVPVGIISAEQDHSQAGLRFISIEGLINSKNFRSAKMTDLEYGRMPRTIDNLKDKPIFINDEPGINITALIRQARRWKQERNIGILFVDYIQKIKGTDRRMITVERVTEVVNSLKDLARELQIPVVALAQVNREADKLSGPPEPSHLADASACEKEADAIITMYRDDQMREHNTTLLHICKNRHGPTGDVLVNYEGRFFKFTDTQRGAA